MFKKTIYACFIIFSALTLKPTDKQAALLFAVDAGVVISSKEESLEHNYETDTGNSTFKHEQKSANGFFLRAKLLGPIGFGYMTHNTKIKQTSIGGASIEEGETQEINSTFFEVLGHLPIPLSSLIVSGNFGLGSRTLKLKNSSDNNTSITAPVYKYGFDVGTEMGFLLNLRLAFGYNSVMGSKKSKDVSEIYSNNSKVDYEFNPNVTFYTFSVGIGF